MSAAMVELYDYDTDTFTKVPARKALRERLAALSNDTLAKIRLALIEEPYICVGNWANCNIEEGKPVGCLFAAAYMHTDQFMADIDHFGNVREAMRSFEDEGTYNAANALDEDENNVGQVIEAFDAWGAQKSKSRTLEYTFKGYHGQPIHRSEQVLKGAARTELIAMIDTILESR